MKFLDCLCVVLCLVVSSKAKSYYSTNSPDNGINIVPIQPRVPLAASECTSRNDIPVIKLKSVKVEVPLQDARKNIVFSRYNMMSRKLHKESRRIKNVTEEFPDQCLGEGGIQEFLVPVPNRTSYVSEFSIECFDQGLGPVEWEYSGIGDFAVSHGNAVESSQESDSMQMRHIHMPTTYKMVFSNFTDQIVGNYTCRSMDYPEKMNHFYLYAPSQGRPYLVQRGKVINVTAEETNPHVTLPCIANSPDAKVYLFRKFIIYRLGLVISKYQMQPFHIYDPKRGFIIDTSNKAVNPFGVYICTSSYDIRDPTDRIKINLFPPHSFARKSDMPRTPMTLLDMGQKVVRDSLMRFRHIVNSFFI